jgi:AraC-like DNA-binding protein
MLLLDTATLPRPDRETAIRSMLDSVTLPIHLEPAQPQHNIDLRLRVWQVGLDTTLFSGRGTGMRICRTARHCSSTDTPFVCVGVQPHGRARFVQDGHAQQVGPGAMFLADARREYEYFRGGMGESSAVQLRLDRLDLNADDIRNASPRLIASPLHDLVRDHICALVKEADVLDVAGLDIADATMDLVRALVISTLDDHPAIPLDEDARWAAILAYLRRHARDLDLNAERAAHALGMSSSALYRLARQRGTSLPQIILAHKLEGAQRNIERFGTVRGVDWIARRWGFADSGQLRQLLREANAVTADDWPPVPPRSPASGR